MSDTGMNDLFDTAPANAASATVPSEPAVSPAEAEDAALSDLDLALGYWARRHGADRLVARGFALASWAVTQGHTCLALDQIPTALMSATNQVALPDALAASDLVTVLDPDKTDTETSTRPLILEAGRLYLQRYHAYETRLAERLRTLMAAEPNPVNVDALKPGNGLFAADAANPNGSRRNIAGIVNEAGNVLGMMPHPERLAEAALGGIDGKPMFDGLVAALH